MMNMRRSAAGFSIVEVMVALVVLAVGMLGIASLYVTSLQSSGSANSRMQAVNLASDMADRIRANRFVGTSYDEGADDIGAAHDCYSDTCTREEMAENDLFLWQQQIDDQLPGSAPQGTVVFVQGGADTPDTYTIRVSWNEPNSRNAAPADGGAANDQSYTLTMQIEP